MMQPWLSLPVTDPESSDSLLSSLSNPDSGSVLTLAAHGLKPIPVMSAALRPAGVLLARQATRVLLEEVEKEEDLLRDYIEGIGYR